MCLLRHKLRPCPSPVDHHYINFSSSKPNTYSSIITVVPTTLSLQLYQLPSHHYFPNLSFINHSTSSFSMELSPSDFNFTSPDPYKHETSKLSKAYLNEPTLPDLTIHFSDQTVHAHRIMLCRGSEYFTNMLTGRFQVSNDPSFLRHSVCPS